jgi:hypothetical protein
MARRRKVRLVVTIVIVGILLALGVGFRAEHYQCSVCGVQEYERTLFGVPIEFLCEREVDEYGAYAEWRRQHERPCAHRWEPAD